jgi:hypothetical protein
MMNTLLAVQCAQRAHISRLISVGDCALLVRIHTIHTVYPSLLGLYDAATLDQVVALTRKTLTVCTKGLVPTPSDPKIRRESWDEEYGGKGASVVLLHLLVKHYHPSSQQVLDLTDIERSSNAQTHVQTIRVLGDAVEIVYENATLDEALNLSQRPDESFYGLSKLSKEKIFCLYIEPPKKHKVLRGFDFLPKYHVDTTANACVIITESDDEYKQLEMALRRNGKVLRVLDDNRLAIGEGPTTGGEWLPLPVIAANPLIVSSDALDANELVDVLYSIVSIGEIHSIMETLMDIREIVEMGGISLPSNLRRQLGRPRINPLLDLKTLYGYRPLTQAEDDFYSVHHDLALLEHLGTASEDPARIEIELVRELLGLIDLDGRTRTTDKDAIENIYRSFCKTVARFSGTLAKVLNEAESTLERATTVVQMNIAIMAILWTGVLTVLTTVGSGVMQWILDAMGAGLYVAGGFFILIFLVSYMRLLCQPKS